jgi:hypothetical protein
MQTGIGIDWGQFFEQELGIDWGQFFEQELAPLGSSINPSLPLEGNRIY